MGLVQPITCTVGVIRGGGLGIPPPHLGCHLGRGSRAPVVVGARVCISVCVPASALRVGVWLRLWARIALASPWFWSSCSLPYVTSMWTIAATASVVVLCSSSADMFCGRVCVTMSCGGGFTADGTYGSVWDSVKPMTGNSSYFQFQRL